MTFNGWASYSTWNVSLYIQNEYELYKAAQQFTSYKSFIPTLESMMGDKTPDGVSWTDPTIDINELDEMLQDL